MIQFGTETRVAVIDPVTRRFYDCEDRLAGLSFGVISKEKVSQQDLKLLKRLLKVIFFIFIFLFLFCFVLFSCFFFFIQIPTLSLSP